MASANPLPEGMTASLPCKVFSEFKEALQSMRAVDDRIIYKLNTSVPTESFQDQVDAKGKCKELYEQLRWLYTARHTAIQSCIRKTSEKINELREKRDAGGDGAVVRELRKEQTRLRLMQNELAVEEVVKDRSIKVFKERCWKSYKPPDLE